MDAELALQRRFFAEEIRAVANLKSVTLVEAIATVPREQFLRPGPWLVRAQGDFAEPPRQTPNADPRHVNHNVSIAIDLARQLFNDAPGLVAAWIDALDLKPGERVLHVGCGLGYYSALMARLVGPTGRVIAIEVDDGLVADARGNLGSFGWVEVRRGDGIDILGEQFDAVLVNAGMTHPHEARLRALRPRGRLLLPLTATMPQMGTVGKGFGIVFSDRAGDDGALDARVLTLVAIYSAVGIRDEAMNALLGKALMSGPWPAIKRLRRNRHEPSASCWLHGDTFCLAS